MTIEEEVEALRRIAIRGRRKAEMADRAFRDLEGEPPRYRVAREDERPEFPSDFNYEMKDDEFEQMMKKKKEMYEGDKKHLARSLYEQEKNYIFLNTTEDGIIHQRQYGLPRNLAVFIGGVESLGDLVHRITNTFEEYDSKPLSSLRNITEMWIDGDSLYLNFFHEQTPPKVKKKVKVLKSRNADALPPEEKGFREL